ncbi:monovalent cation/H(+) antiporter subunit G [Aromatoleum evansii]|uniref:monovalent cation/H(+) antiporter subunit G n=1 Tax=Aromatoleum evansii TaxID=59406 RepID=UPI001FEB850E|nr:monovalent cation/H(+) antiporter subunit G [Aromatoleum evansii]
MTALDAMPWWAALTASFLLVLGGLITLIGTVGLLRLKTFYQRIHGPAITITLGTGCILIASMVYFTVTQSRLVIHEILIAAFVLMTAPVVSMLIMRAALYRNQYDSRVVSARSVPNPEQELVERGALQPERSFAGDPVNAHEGRTSPRS